MKKGWEFLTKIFSELKKRETVSFDIVSNEGNPLLLTGIFRDSDGVQYQFDEEESLDIRIEIYKSLGLEMITEGRRVTFKKTRPIRKLLTCSGYEIVEIMKSNKEETFIIDNELLDGIEHTQREGYIELEPITTDFSKYKERLTPDNKGFFNLVYYYVNENGGKMSIKKIDENTCEIKITPKK